MHVEISVVNEFSRLWFDYKCHLYMAAINDVF